MPNGYECAICCHIRYVVGNRIADSQVCELLHAMFGCTNVLVDNGIEHELDLRICFCSLEHDL